MSVANSRCRAHDPLAASVINSFASKLPTWLRRAVPFLRQPGGREKTLSTTDGCQGFCPGGQVVAPVRPVRRLPDIFTVFHAVNVAAF